ncbi:hypothetical protein [Escherichia coli]
MQPAAAPLFSSSGNSNFKSGSGLLLVMVSLYRVLDQEYTRERRQAQRQRHMIDAWIAREMAAQEETQAEAARAHDQD